MDRHEEQWMLAHFDDCDDDGVLVIIEVLKLEVVLLLGAVVWCLL